MKLIDRKKANELIQLYGATNSVLKDWKEHHLCDDMDTFCQKRKVTS